MRKPKAMKAFYRRSLPHLVPPGAVLFITFRLQHSIPLDLLKKYHDEYHKEVLSSISNIPELSDKYLPWSPNNPVPPKPFNSKRVGYDIAFKKFFKKVDDILDRRAFGPTWLEKPELAQVVSKKLHSFDYKYYWLMAYTILPNHVHVLIDTHCQIRRIPPNTPITEENYTPYQKFMNLIKGATAKECNQLLNQTGKRFWQKESWDRMVRDEEEFYRIIAYILNNPVKAKLAKRWQEHPYTWLNAEYQELFKELHP